VLAVVRVAGKGLVAAVTLGLLTSGCGSCTSLPRTREISDDLRQKNLARAEPDMLSAVQRLGATLLPDTLQQLGFMRLCEATSDAGLRTSCVVRSRVLIPPYGKVGEFYEVFDHEGKRSIALSVSERIVLARLATRGNALLLLSTAEEFRWRHGTLCDCGGDAAGESRDGYVNLGRAFVFDDLPARIESVVVPFVGDAALWFCPRNYVQNAPFKAKASHEYRNSATHEALDVRCPHPG